MGNFAYDDDLANEVSATPSSSGVQSATRLRTVYGCGTEMALAVDAFETAIRMVPASDIGPLRGMVPLLRMVEMATCDVERWTRVLGATHVTHSWLEACTDWMTAITDTLVSSLAYVGIERTMAVELAAEESQMRLSTRLEREGADAVAMLKNLDRGASLAAQELVARMDLVDRTLHAV
jgi:hypothetical protein